jgi:hypothetical protein
MPLSRKEKTMKPTHIFPSSMLAMALGLLPLAATAQNRYANIETAHVNAPKPAVEAKPAAPTNPTQSANSGSGWTDGSGHHDGVVSSSSPPNAPQANIKLTDILVSSVVLPSSPQPGQTAGITSPRDPASGQATDARQQVPGTDQGENKLGNFEIQDVRGNPSETVNAAPGASDQFIGGTGDGQGIRKKQPRRDRTGTRGKRKAKP